MSKSLHTNIIPAYNLMRNDFPVMIESLDHKNPYDFTKEHRHEYFELILTEKGGGRQWIDFTCFDMQNQSCYIVLPKQVHLLKRNEFTQGYVIQFRDTAIQSSNLLTYLMQLRSPVVFENDPDACVTAESYLNLLRKIQYPIRESSKTGSIYLLQAFLMHLIDFKSMTKIEGHTDIVHSQFASLVDSQFLEKKSVKEYLPELNISQARLTASTLKHFGVTPLQYIHNRILLEIKRMLVFGHQSQKEIAYELGFNNQAVFSQFVKAKTGYSPSELQHHLSRMHEMHDS